MADVQDAQDVAKNSGADEAGAAGAVWQVVKTFWSLLLGHALEIYEFTLYIFLEPYFEENFFQGSAVVAWLGFAITFVARPFGGVVLGLIGDLFGRKVSTFLSIFGMLGSTVLQGVLPTFQDGPVAGTIGVCLLVFLRLVQGISVGGEIASVSTYITEICHPRILARTLVLLPLTASLGSFCAQLVTCLAEELLGDEDMHSWGWRLPFLLAIIPGAMATLGRRCIPESRIFSEAKATAETGRSAKSKTRELLVKYWPQLLVGFGALAGKAMLDYGALTWGFVSLKKNGVPSIFRMVLGIACFSLLNLMAFPVGYLTDRVGVACVQLFTALGLAILGPPLMITIDSFVLAGDYWVAIVIYSVGWSIFSALFMVQMLRMTELFPVEVRNAGVGLSYNVGICVFGGFAPMLFEAASTISSSLPGVFLALGAMVTAITILVSLWLQGLGKIRLTHLRHEPYFRCCGQERFRFPDAADAKKVASVQAVKDASPHKEEGIQSVVGI